MRGSCPGRRFEEGAELAVSLDSMVGYGAKVEYSLVSSLHVVGYFMYLKCKDSFG